MGIDNLECVCVNTLPIIRLCGPVAHFLNYDTKTFAMFCGEKNTLKTTILPEIIMYPYVTDIRVANSQCRA